MAVVTALAPYTDDRGNSIEIDGSVESSVHVDFQAGEEQQEGQPDQREHLDGGVDGDPSQQ